MRRAITTTTMLTAMLAAALWPTAAGAQEAGDVDVEQDIVYATRGDLKLAFDAYLPPGDGPRPAVIWVHGGKWNQGDKADREDVEISTILAAQGFAAFSVNYRLANIDTASYPEAAQDVSAAVGWIRDHADRFGVDPARIAIAGESSGAHLAALAGTLGEGPLTEGSRVSAVVSFSGPLDLAPLLHDENPNLVGAVSTFLGCSPDDASCDALAAEASPVTHVDPTDPPFFITNATGEIIPEEQATSMADALEAQDVPVELMVVNATQHGLGYVSYQKMFGPERQTLPQMYLGFLGDRLDHEVDVQGAPSSLPSVSTPAASPKTAPTEGSAPVAPGEKTSGNEPKGEDSNGWLLTLTVVALIVAAASIAATLLMLRRLRRAGAAPPAPEGDDEQRARVEAGARRV